MLVILTTAACGGGGTTSPSPIGSSSGSSSGGSGGTGGSGTSPNGTVTFKVDGVQNSASGVTATYVANILSIGATDTARPTTLGFAVSASSPGTYAMGPLSPTNALIQIGNPAQGWSAGVGTGSGSVTLTTLTATNAVGTFTFTMVPVAGSGATGNKSITDGVFNVTLR